MIQPCSLPKSKALAVASRLKNVGNSRQHVPCASRCRADSFFASQAGGDSCDLFFACASVLEAHSPISISRRARSASVRKRADLEAMVRTTIRQEKTGGSSCSTSVFAEARAEVAPQSFRDGHGSETSFRFNSLGMASVNCQQCRRSAMRVHRQLQVVPGSFERRVDDLFGPTTSHLIVRKQ